MNVFLSFLFFISFFLGGCHPSGKAVEKDKKLKSFYITRGKNYAETQNIAHAVITLQEAVKYYPDDPEAYFLIGDLFMGLKDYATARRYFAGVIHLQPDNAFAYLRTAACYDLSGDRRQAVQSVRKSVEIFRQKNDVVNFKVTSEILRRLFALEPTGP